MSLLLPPFLNDAIFNGAEWTVLVVAALVALFLTRPRRHQP